MRIPSPFFTSFKETPPKAEHLRNFNKKNKYESLNPYSYGTLPNLLLRSTLDIFSFLHSHTNVC